MTTLKIKGMSCQHCVNAVIKALNEIDGIKDAKVDLAKGEATFEETKSVDPEKIKARITQAGYQVV